MRHAQAATAANDTERPLTITGRQEAEIMGRLLNLRGPLPQVVIVSDAARALETARIVTEVLAVETPLVVAPQLYLAPVDQWLSTLHEIGPGLSTALMIGHNPGITQFARQLRGSGRSIDGFGPAYMANFDLPVDRWSDVEPGKALCRWLLGPREAVYLIM